LYSALKVADIGIGVEDQIRRSRLLVFALALAGVAVPDFFFSWNVSVGLTINWIAVAKSGVIVEVEALSASYSLVLAHAGC